jgi:hypothetical protein
MTKVICADQNQEAMACICMLLDDYNAAVCTALEAKCVKGKDILSDPHGTEECELDQLPNSDEDAPHWTLAS